MQAKDKTEDMGLVVGKKVGEIICASFQVFGDMVVVWGSEGETKVFSRDSIAKKPTLYQIEGEPIVGIFIPDNHEILILKTKKRDYFRDFSNQNLDEGDHWADYYFEPFTASFYRKDQRGNWFDIEGYRLGAPVFLKDNVLCSLPGKVSKKSLSFKNQKILISPHTQLIQVGKLVYNLQLEAVHFFGEKITGLASKNISFGKKDSLQQVHLGLTQTAFIHEFTHAPLLINNEEIIDHVQTAVLSSNQRFEVFASKQQQYFLEMNSSDIFCWEEKPAMLDLQTHLSFGAYELVLVQQEKKQLFIDLNTRTAFKIPGLGDEQIISIGSAFTRVNGATLYNIKTAHQSLVYNATLNQIFTLEEDSLRPESVQEIAHFDSYLAMAFLEGRQNIFHKNQNKLLRLGEKNTEIKVIKSHAEQKLLNALSTKNEALVIDTRNGFDQLSLAQSTDRRIIEVLGEPQHIGNTVVQNVLLETLGDAEPRVIDLNSPQLAIFTLPHDLKEYAEQASPSIFQGNALLSLDFKIVIKIQEASFIKGLFLTYLGQTQPVLLQLKNGRPLHLNGTGHRNELVTDFQTNTIDKEYHLGANRMIGATTLTEELKENELVFSIDKLTSWLPFFDSYLPILKKIQEIQSEETWEYLLFELRVIAKVKEYIVVEQEPPYRILVEQKKGKYHPRVINRKDRISKSPEEEISAIRRLFQLNPSYLVDVE